MPQAVLAAGLCRSGAVFGCCYFDVKVLSEGIYLPILLADGFSAWSTFSHFSSNFFRSLARMSFFLLCSVVFAMESVALTSRSVCSR